MSPFTERIRSIAKHHAVTALGRACAGLVLRPLSAGNLIGTARNSRDNCPRARGQPPTALLLDQLRYLRQLGVPFSKPELGGGRGNWRQDNAPARADRDGRERLCPPPYVDTVIRRWHELTGGSARHAASGRNLDDLACEAEAANAV